MQPNGEPSSNVEGKPAREPMTIKYGPPHNRRTYATCQIRLESTHQKRQAQEASHDHQTSNAPPPPGPAGA